MTERLAVLAAIALSVAGCGGSGAETAPGQAATSGGMHGRIESAAACPTMLPGVEVSVEEVDSGAAMTFTTSEPAQVDELRARVRVMADMHEQRVAMPAGRAGTMPPATASVIEVPGGARLELRAIEATDQDALRELALAHADEMRTMRTCPTMAAPAPS